MKTRWNARRLAQLLALLAVVGLAVVFRGPLLAWFRGAPVESERAGQGELTQSGDVQRDTLLSAPALEYVRAAFDAYEAARAQLADDKLEGLDARAAELAQLLRTAADAVEHEANETTAQAGGGAHAHGASNEAGGAHEDGSARAQIGRELRQAAEHAEQLASSRELAQARVRFAGLSESLITLAATDPRLQEGFHVFSCPMVEGFNKWLQRSSQLDNPYMGTRMPACGSESPWHAGAEPAQDEAAEHTEHAHGTGEISHYTCPMHPAIREPGPGKCPICGMDLTPVTRAEVESGVIMVDPGRRQVIGIKTAKVAVAPLVVPVRALGVIAYDETKLVDVTLKLDGYIHDLRVDATGEPVAKGDVLFTLYSPELYAAQEEYLLALASENPSSASLVRASERRLALWGLTKAQIATIAEDGQPTENMPFLSPASGYVLEKNVIEGGSVKAGERLFRIVPLKTVWVEADVYEQDLAQVKVGQQVRVTLPYLPDQSHQGRVAYVYPTLDKQTRTGKVRIELPNRELTLKPAMYADVRFEVKAGDQLQVPESAVLYTGPRTLVFVDLGKGRLRPQEVKLGSQGEAGIEVLEGLAAGDVVVTSGNFLIAAESRIRSAADYWTGGDHEAH